MRKYKTSQGDTWDLIAYKVYKKYGGEILMDILMEYNEEYITTVIFPANIILNIPKISEPVVYNLPPWKVS
ncbi:MAG: hypothetical protein IJP69_03525 [Synergistaceae bacterium]|nr:hypothetical protein [Synergistaceae bacterium]MBR0254218.1 hypothetical protein [Synergistaceae bacterium]